MKKIPITWDELKIVIRQRVKEVLPDVEVRQIRKARYADYSLYPKISWAKDDITKQEEKQIQKTLLEITDTLMETHTIGEVLHEAWANVNKFFNG